MTRKQTSILASLAFVLGISVAQAQVPDAGPVVVPAAVESGSGSAAPAPAPAPEATPAPTVPDPVEHPVDAGSFVYKLWKGGALIPAIIVGLFLVLTFLSRKVKWLQEDHRAVYVAAALGTLTLLLEPATRGTTPNASMVIAALAAGVGLALNPKKPAADAEKRAA